MSVAHNMRVSTVNRLKFDGWQIADDYPAAGITIMVRGQQVLTVLKNGRIKAGVHPPK